MCHCARRLQFVSSRPESTRRAASNVRWSLAAIALHLGFLALVASANDWNLSPLIEAHDGGYYLSHLEDPLLLSPPEWWDNVPYRGVRLGYIVLSLPFRWLGGITALVVANMVGLVAGLHAIRAIARRCGANSRIAGIVWIFNPGALASTALLLPDTIAWAAILLALLAMADRKWAWATLAAVFAVATKEASLAALVLPAAVQWKRGRRAAAVPVVSAGAFQASILTLLVARFGPSFHDSFVTWPLKGWIEAIPWWLDGHVLSGVAGLLALLGGLAVIFIWLRRRSFYLGAAAGQAVLLISLSFVVVAPMVNTARVAGLFWPLLAATGRDPSDST